MDTIQTLMFDLKINNGVQVRESIKRWNGNEINREYQRENVSKDDFMVKNFEYRYEKRFLVVIMSRSFSETNTPASNCIEANYRTFGTGVWVYIFPMFTNAQIIQMSSPRVYINGTRYFLGDTFSLGIPYNLLLSNPYTVNMFVSSSPYLHDVCDYSIEHVQEEDEHGTIIEDYWKVDIKDYLGTLSLTNHFKYPEADSTESRVSYLGFTASAIKLDFVMEGQKGIQINGKTPTKNTSIGVNFDEQYIPQLIDENYIQISYGEKLGATSFPLSILRDKNIRLYSTYDLISNARAYKITPETYQAFNYKDVYNTTVASQSLESFNLITDAWETYQATHKGSLTTGLQLQMVNNVYKFASASALGMTNALPLSKTNTHQAIMDLGTSRGRTTVTGEAGRITKSYNRANNKFSTYDSETNYYGGVRGVTAKADFAMDMINTVANYQITKENMQFTPDVVGQGSNLYCDTSTRSYDCFYQVKEVTDIVACARKLEYYGYAVNKVLDNKYINDLKNRYYYNIIQCTNLTLINTGSRMIPLELIHDFVIRLESGIRLFDIRNNKFLDNLQYDNVELEVISNG